MKKNASGLPIPWGSEALLVSLKGLNLSLITIRHNERNASLISSYSVFRVDFAECVELHASH